MKLHKLVRTSVKLDNNGVPCFVLDIQLTTTGKSEADAVGCMRDNLRNHLEELTEFVKRDCNARLTKLANNKPCSEFRPRVYLTAFRFDTHSCLGDEW